MRNMKIENLLVKDAGVIRCLVPTAWQLGKDVAKATEGKLAGIGRLVLDGHLSKVFRDEQKDVAIYMVRVSFGAETFLALIMSSEVADGDLVAGRLYGHDRKKIPGDTLELFPEMPEKIRQAVDFQTWWKIFNLSFKEIKIEERKATRMAAFSGQNTQISIKPWNTQKN